ncbi:MAG: hypothetical protein Fur0012_04200 [Elusimicrobiota bacterium]
MSILYNSQRDMNDNFEEFEKAEDSLLNKISKEKEDIISLQKENEKKRLLLLKLSVYVQIVIIIFSLILIGSQYPDIEVSVRPQRVLRKGTYSTDAKTDECLNNIWKLMGDRRLKLKCPVSGMDYRIEGKDIYCPSAESHGFKKIYSKNGDIPRIE